MASSWCMFSVQQLPPVTLQFLWNYWWNMWNGCLLILHFHNKTIYIYIQYIYYTYRRCQLGWRSEARWSCTSPPKLSCSAPKTNIKGIHIKITQPFIIYTQASLHASALCALSLSLSVNWFQAARLYVWRTSKILSEVKPGWHYWEVPKFWEVSQHQHFTANNGNSVLDFKAHRVTILPGNALPLASFLLLVAHFREGPHVHMLPVTH